MQVDLFDPVARSKRALTSRASAKRTVGNENDSRLVLEAVQKAVRRGAAKLASTHIESQKIARAPEPTPPTPAPRLADEAWRLEPHVCQHCHSRLVSTPLAGRERLWACPNCGAQAEGEASPVLCACGTKLPRGVKLRCVANPALGPTFPSLYVATEAGD